MIVFYRNNFDILFLKYINNNYKISDLYLLKDYRIGYDIWNAWYNLETENLIIIENVNLAIL